MVQILKNRGLSKVLRSDQNIFSLPELSLILSESDPNSLRSKISYYCKKGELFHIKRGLYSKNKEYDPFELAGKIFSPSYISLETVLFREGVIFQKYEMIFSISYLSRNIFCDSRNFSFKKIKDEVLVNNDGIIYENNYHIASLERALMDTLYFNINYHFDNLSKINWEKCTELLKIYNNKSLEKRLKKYME